MGIRKHASSVEGSEAQATPPKKQRGRTARETIPEQNSSATKRRPGRPEKRVF
ncbi:hypothetical protein BDB00DRAFT_804970 [Zychaea mexicana]|uniref:uncharacterized protein n=1 Tax=Zychaea mexicana TaxID=64656 RepID=UPI0022FE61E3|nr:uncharacterized protein BDB00DRAFT_804970 [Zychaea mexicana]KAI9497531.1 hypothetical protein BDB00DRAFT_804970 [Zychaea mexicana]